MPPPGTELVDAPPFILVTHCRREVKQPPLPSRHAGPL
jgi:hypothetical protein